MQHRISVMYAFLLVTQNVNQSMVNQTLLKAVSMDAIHHAADTPVVSTTAWLKLIHNVQAMTAC